MKSRRCFKAGVSYFMVTPSKSKRKSITISISKPANEAKESGVSLSDMIGASVAGSLNTSNSSSVSWLRTDQTALYF